MDDMTNFQRNFSTGEVEVHGSAIYHKTEYRERRNHYALYAVNAPVDGFDTDRDSFLGAYGENSAPEVVVSDQSKNSIASGMGSGRLPSSESVSCSRRIQNFRIYSGIHRESC